MPKKKKKLEKGLKHRHIQMMAIGGAIGTGLFLGAGKSIHLAGPSILLAYFVTGIICFLIMRALGELLLSDLRHSSFIGQIRVYFGERWAFVTGWTYWFCWACIAMADLTAVGIYIQYWFPGVPQWLPALLALCLLLGLNLLTVKLFGEIEFWFALIKVIAILCLIGVGIYLMVIGFQTTQGDKVSLSHIWEGGFFATGFKGYILSFQMVVFAFVGIEMVGVTVAEMEHPEKCIPLAVNNIPIRVLLFYIGSLVVIMSVIPWASVNPARSPFVEVFSIVGVVAAAGVVNFVVLTSSLSACNSGIYATSRILYNMGRRSEAPKSFGKLNTRKIPSKALWFSAVIIFISVILNYLIPAQVFTLVTSISTCCFLFVWGMIILCHHRYRQLLKQERLPAVIKAVPGFRMPFYPFSTVVVLFFLCFVGVVLFLAPDTRIAILIVPLWILFLLLAFNLRKRLFPDLSMGFSEEEKATLELH